MAIAISIPYICVALYQLKIYFCTLYPIYSHIILEAANDILIANHKLRHEEIK